VNIVRGVSSNRIRRAALHAAIGEPSRLAIVEELLVSDRSVQELTVRLDIASNLLAHHLDVLEGVDLIERVVSSGDRRRRYVRLRTSVVDDLELARVPVPAMRVLFVCTHNSARSQLAAAVWREYLGGRVSSAGTEPAPRVHPGAVTAARRAGFDISRARPRLLAPIDLTAELIVTVCDRAHEALDTDARWRHWSIPDPVEVGTRQAFDSALQLIDDHVRRSAAFAA
jgi:protein-tyrosine-phosphatase/DNA-binding HxlR family transcriptional regulator